MSERQSLLILLSRWRNVELLWLQPNQWLTVHDRPVRHLTDSEVRQLFGDEAFRRRDVLRTTGERVYHPQASQLISRSVVAALEQSGWNVVIDDAMNDHEETFRAEKSGHVLAVRVPESNRWALELTVDERTKITSSLAEIERALLIEQFQS